MFNETNSLIDRALSIIESQLDIGDNLQIRSSGSEGIIMEAVNLFKSAHLVEPNNVHIYYAYISSLRLAAQYGSSIEELKKLIELKPDFALAKLSLEAWEETTDISPSMFRFPEWNTATKVIHQMYKKHVTNFVLFPARNGIYPKAVLFEKDYDNWWTKEKLKDMNIEIAFKLYQSSSNILGIYRWCTGPYLNKPDIQESLTVLDLPKYDHSLVPVEYLCELDSIDIVIFDRNYLTLLNQTVPISNKCKITLSEVKTSLLNSQGRKFSSVEIMNALINYQNNNTLDNIERNYFS